MQNHPEALPIGDQISGRWRPIWPYLTFFMRNGRPANFGWAPARPKLASSNQSPVAPRPSPWTAGKDYKTPYRPSGREIKYFSPSFRPPHCVSDTSSRGRSFAQHCRWNTFADQTIGRVKRCISEVNFGNLTLLSANIP